MERQASNPLPMKPWKPIKLPHFLVQTRHLNLKRLSSLPSDQTSKTPTPTSLFHLIDSCQTLQQLKQIHAKSIASGLSYDHFILSKLAKSFLNNRNLDYAALVFAGICEPGIFIWNAIIRAYSSSETPCFAISIYNEMQIDHDVRPDNHTFPFVFRACGRCSASEKGREVHGMIVKTGYEKDRFIQSSLLGFYSVCTGIDDARQVFDEFMEKDIVFWNAMITAYARVGNVMEAFQLFGEMESKKVKPNEGTMLGLVSACVVNKDAEHGRDVYEYVNREMGSVIGVKLGAALIDLNVKCGNLSDAQKIFDELPERSTVAWNSLIYGYFSNGYPSKAIQLFQEMHASNVRLDKFTISTVLSVCAQVGALNLGEWLRRYIEKNRIYDVFVGTALIDVYCKCGSVTLAREIFDQIPCKNIATWNAILSGYALHGHAERTLELFHEMKRSSTRPDSITFVAVLSACAHAGLVEDGYRYLDLMRDYYGISPKVEHYGCLVDLLGRAGLLKEAMQLIETMEIKPNAVVWGSLLSACSIHGNVEIGEQAAARIFELDQMDGGSYVLLSNAYAGAQRFDRVKAVRERMAERGVRKPPGCSMIEIDDIVHEFVVADKAHPKSEEIYLVLNELSRRLKMAGNAANLSTDQE